MEIQKGPYEDYSPFRRGAISVSMLVGASVTFMVQSCKFKVTGVGWWVSDVQGLRRGYVRVSGSITPIMDAQAENTKEICMDTEFYFWI